MVSNYLLVVGAVVNSHAGKKRSTAQAPPVFVCVSKLSTITEAVSKQRECFERGILR